MVFVCSKRLRALFGRFWIYLLFNNKHCSEFNHLDDTSGEDALKRVLTTSFLLVILFICTMVVDFASMVFISEYRMTIHLVDCLPVTTSYHHQRSVLSGKRQHHPGLNFSILVPFGAEANISMSLPLHK